MGANICCGSAVVISCDAIIYTNSSQVNLEIT